MKTMAQTRSSLRQAARPSPVPVAERAQRKQPADHGMQVIFQTPEQAIKALKAATRLGNKKLAKALATMVEESDATEMEVQ